MYNHRTIVGKTTEVTNTKQVVRGFGEISEENKAAKRISNADFNMEASMGLDVAEANIKFHETGVTINGQKFRGPHYVISNALLDEMTITEEGRDSMTKIHRLSRIELSKIKGKKPVKNTRKPSTGDDDDDVDIEDDVEESGLTRLEMSRIINLQTKYPKYAKEIANGLEKGHSLARIRNTVRLRSMEDQLPKPPKARGTGDNDLLAGRLLLSVSASENTEKMIEKKFGPKKAEVILNAGPIGLKELLVEGANRLGGRFTGYSDCERLVNFVGGHNATAIKNTGFSSFSMPNLFESVTTMVMEEAWLVEELFAPKHCYVNSNTNFLPTRRIRPAGGQMWEGLDANGRIKHGNFGKEHVYENKLDTKAQVLGFNREMIENDDMGAIQELLNLMVDGALIVPDVKLLTHLMQDNGAFFRSAASGDLPQNDFSNSGSYALSATSLDTVYLSARKQSINKGRVTWQNMVSDKWYLVTGPTLERTAWELCKQRTLIGPTDSRQGQDNYWYGKVEPLTFNQLENTSISEKAKSDMWFLWPKQTKYAPFAITYLRNRKRPIVQVKEAPVDMLGFIVVGVFDVEINDRESQAIRRVRPTNFGS